MKKPKKSCRDRVDKLKRKKKCLSRQDSRGRSVKRTGSNKFGVTTQDIRVATRTRHLHQNSVTTLSKSVVPESKKELINQVATEYCMS